jgi:hypothetical protein
MLGLTHIHPLRRLFGPAARFVHDRDHKVLRGRWRASPAVVPKTKARARDELAAFGLCDLGAGGPASLATLSDVSQRESLEALSLLRTGTPRSTSPTTLADASPYDFLLYLGLMG